MNEELQRLQELYRDMSKEELLALAGDQGELTAEAQAALAGELGRRGLEPPAPAAADDPDRRITASAPVEHAYGFGVGIPGVVPGGEPSLEHALEPGGQTRLGMAALTAFFDGMELSRACELLEAAGIAPAIEEIGGDETVGVAPRFEVWVSEDALEQSKVLLRSRMGLFPLAEMEGLGGSFAADGDGVVGQFETRSEAEQIRMTLESAGLPARLEEDGAEEGARWLVKVAPEQQERALDLVAVRLGLEPAQG